MYSIEGYALDVMGRVKCWATLEADSSQTALERAEQMRQAAVESNLDGTIYVRRGTEWIAKLAHGACPEWFTWAVTGDVVAISK